MRAALSAAVWAVVFNVFQAVGLLALEVSTGYVWFSEPYWLYGTWLITWFVAGLWIGFMRSWARSKRGAGIWVISWVRSSAKSARSRASVASMDKLEPSAASSFATPPSPAPSGKMVPLKSVVVGISVVIALLAAFGIGMAVDSLDLQTDRDTDAEVMAEIQTHATAWNDIAGPLVEDYLDPDVDAMQWAEAAQFPIDELEAALSGIEYEAARLSDPDLQDFVSDVVANKTDKLTALAALMNAIESGDHNAELTAWSDFSAAAVDGRRLEQELASYPEE